MIRRCDDRDFESIHAVINDGAQAYRGIIPADRWTDPYMSSEHLQHEIDAGVGFWGYVRTSSQGTGIGARLLAHLLEGATRPVLIGTWADAVWAIRFYEKHGFRVVGTDEKDRLLKKYWTVPQRLIETSVVLASV